VSSEKTNSEINTKKKTAAGLSVFSNTTLIVLKVCVGIVTGSISIISEALHSLVDLAASFIAYFSVVKSAQPADEDHPFGHGKYEDLAGFVEAILIILTAIYILYIAAEKLVKSGSGHYFETDLGIAIMTISTVANFVVSRYLFYTAKVTDSIALHTDAEHLSMDVYSSFSILAGLVAVKFTGLYVLDPIFAIIVAAIILKTGLTLTKQASNNLLDGALPNAEKEVIQKVLEGFKEHGLKGVKAVKTSKSGSKRIIQLIILLPCDMTLKNTHILCDEIENSIGEHLNNASVIIHSEPDCKNCGGGVMCNNCKYPKTTKCKKHIQT